MAGKIFINYRTRTSAKEAKLLRDVLYRHFGEARVFLDTNGLEGGDNWPTKLAKQVDEADAMVALICAGWADIRDDNGKRRLDNPYDFVRFEIARALVRGIPFIPVRIDGAVMPDHKALPPELSGLASMQAMLLRHESSDDDGEKIAERLKALLAERRREVRRWQKIAGAASVAALAVGLAAGWWLALEPGAVAQDAAELRKRAVTAEEGVRRLGRALEEAVNRAQTVEAGRKGAETRLAAAEGEVARLKDALSAAGDKDGAAARRIASLTGELEAKKKETVQALAQVEEKKKEAAQVLAQVEALKKEIGGQREEIAGLKKQLAAAPARPAEPHPTSAGPQPGKVAVKVRGANGREETRWLTPGGGAKDGESFQDCFNPDCAGSPEMVVVPRGSFMMGSPKGENDRQDNEGPQVKVTFEEEFAVGKFEVTFEEWDACVAYEGCKYKPEAKWGRGDQPVINVSWEDAQAYVKWLSEKTGMKYRLLSEAEWEYAARAGTVAAYWWGKEISHDDANYYGGAGRTVQVKSFKPNPWGLYQVHGNVWEWVEDCWNDNYFAVPRNGSAWTAGDCGRRVVRGGSWSYDPRYLRSAFRYRYTPGDRGSNQGFRLGRTLTP